jgi:hypothetical protein
MVCFLWDGKGDILLFHENQNVPFSTSLIRFPFVPLRVLFFVVGPVVLAAVWR